MTVYTEHLRKIGYENTGGKGSSVFPAHCDSMQYCAHEKLPDDK